MWLVDFSQTYSFVFSRDCCFQGGSQPLSIRKIGGVFNFPAQLYQHPPQVCALLVDGLRVPKLCPVVAWNQVAPDAAIGFYNASGHLLQSLPLASTTIECSGQKFRLAVNWTL